MSLARSRVSKLAGRKKSHRVELEGMSQGSMLKRKERLRRTGIGRTKDSFRSVLRIQSAMDCEDSSCLS